MTTFATADDATKATLLGRIMITGRSKAADLNVPAFQYIKVADDGYGAVVISSGEPPLSTESVAREVRALIEALPGHEFKGALIRRASGRFGGARSRIEVSGRDVKF